MELKFIFALSMLLASLLQTTGFLMNSRRNSISLNNILTQQQGTKSMKLHMAAEKKSGKQATFGVFSPAVYLAKLVLGETKLNKV